MKRWLAFAVVGSLAFVLAHEAHAMAPDVRPTEPAPAATATPAGLLAAADAAVAAGDLQLAYSLFQRLVAERPATPEANEARRALRIIAARISTGGLAPTPSAEEVSATDDDIVIRNEPYSRRTAERLRLSIWEKVDFGVTSFLYVDGIPDEDGATRTSWHRRLMPAMVQMAGADGSAHPGFGVGGTFF